MQEGFITNQKLPCEYEKDKQLAQEVEGVSSQDHPEVIGNLGGTLQGITCSSPIWETQEKCIY